MWRTRCHGDMVSWCDVQDTVSWFAVFDGHAGGRVSAHCSHHLLDCIRWGRRRAVIRHLLMTTSSQSLLSWQPSCSDNLYFVLITSMFSLQPPCTQTTSIFSWHPPCSLYRASDEFTCSLQQEHSLSQEEVNSSMGCIFMSLCRWWRESRRASWEVSLSLTKSWGRSQRWGMFL